MLSTFAMKKQSQTLLDEEECKTDKVDGSKNPKPTSFDRRHISPVDGREKANLSAFVVGRGSLTGNSFASTPVLTNQINISAHQSMSQANRNFSQLSQAPS